MYDLVIESNRSCPAVSKHQKVLSRILKQSGAVGIVAASIWNSFLSYLRNRLVLPAP